MYSFLNRKKEEPPCDDCLPYLQDENKLVYEVYWRAFNIIENVDPFKIMDMLGIKNHLYCLDLIQSTRNEVMRIKHLESKTNA